MRILVVINDLPHPPFIGFHVRLLSVLEALASRHQVVAVGCAPAAADLSVLRSVCDAVRVTTVLQNTALREPRRDRRVLLSRARSTVLPLPTLRASHSAPIARLVDEEVAAQRPDVIHLETLYAAHYSRPGIPTVIELHDVYSDYCRLARQSHPLRYALAPLQRRMFERAERRVLKSAAAVITINDRDRDLLALKGIDAMTVPFAISLPVAPRDRPSGEDTRLLFVGTFEARANQDTVRFIERELVPALDRCGMPYRLTIAGRKARPLSRRASPRVVYAADPPDLGDYYRDADIVLAPIPYGGGTKTKTLEAMSYARPVVGTASAFTGIEGLTGSTHVECALDGRALATAVARLAADPRERERIGSAARRYVEVHHTQAAVEQALACVYDDLSSRLAPR